MRTNERSGETRKSRLGEERKSRKALSLSEEGPGQNDPRHYPHPESSELILGGPLGIEDVAVLLGCSPWTVRQKYLPQGLPHLRTGNSGRFVFFRTQVMNWILDRQKKGGRP
jgi:hypothetical protein